MILSKMWGCCLCKHGGNQRGPYLVIWAVQSRPRGEGKNVFLVRGSAGQAACWVSVKPRELRLHKTLPKGRDKGGGG